MSETGDAQPAIRRDGTVLGFDVGARRIGVAVGSALGSGARAVAVVDVHATGPDWNRIEMLRREWRPDGMVVGDPMTLDGALAGDPHIAGLLADIHYLLSRRTDQRVGDLPAFMGHSGQRYSSVIA